MGGVCGKYFPCKTFNTFDIIRIAASRESSDFQGLHCGGMTHYFPTLRHEIYPHKEG